MAGVDVVVGGAKDKGDEGGGGAARSSVSTRGSNKSKGIVPTSVVVGARRSWSSLVVSMGTEGWPVVMAEEEEEEEVRCGGGCVPLVAGVFSCLGRGLPLLDERWHTGTSVRPCRESCGGGTPRWTVMGMPKTDL